MEGVRTKKHLEYYPERKMYKLTDAKQPDRNPEMAVTMEDKLLDSGFTMIPNTLIENYKQIGLEDRHLILIMCLLKYAYGKNRPYPSQATIATIMNKDERTTRRTIQELRTMGYISIYKRYYHKEGSNPKRISNVYSLKGLIQKLENLQKSENK